MKMPELLAPVGGKSHLTAAVNSGADAVYMGGLAFNARIFADNFRDDELPEALEFAHLRGVKVYITLNTLLRDSELAKAFEYANYLYSIGVDGLIVQDMGLARLIHKYLPDFPLHLSTQGTLYNKEAVSLARRMGFCRVVPAREVSLEEIKEIVRAGEEEIDGVPPADVEVFVHGALCMCYSGQCQMSRMLGAGRKGSAGESNTGSCRSGNRGTCAQPCRHSYTDESGRTYYALSPKDLCQIDNIPDLVMSGAASLKIEGRIKAPEYVATVTSIYRKYLDLFDSLCRQYGPAEAKERYSVAEEDKLMLRQIFNRGNFTSGYLYGDPGEDLLSGVSPKNQGIYAGRVVAVIDSEDKVSEIDEKRAARGALKRGKVLVCIALSKGFTQGVSPGDGLEFRCEDEDAPREAVGSVTTFIKDIGGGELIVGDFDRGVRRGDLAFKVTDKAKDEDGAIYLYYGGFDIWYTPEGFRNILQIVIQPNKDVLDAYNTARRSVTMSDEEKAAAHQAVLDDCKELTDEIYARLEAGESFESLIAEYDTSTETLGKTVDMPIMVNTTSVYWNDGVINAAFDAQMTEPGCYSQPYADKGGVHIAYYVSDVPSGFIEYTDEIGAAIEQYLISVKREETIFGWADEYEIVINEDEINAMIERIEAEAAAAEEAELAAIQAYAEQVEKERAEAAAADD